MIFDHARQRVLAVANEIEGEVTVAEAERQLARLTRVLTGEAPGGGVALPGLPGWRPRPLAEATPSLDGAAFQAAVRRAKEHIAAGDIFQVVLARRWPVRGASSRSRSTGPCGGQPVPYMVLLELPEARAGRRLARDAGAQVEGGQRRDPADRRHPAARRDAEEDRRSRDELLADPKERAEHVMLVDLGRNDLGRVAESGSVRVAELHGGRALQPRDAPGLERRRASSAPGATRSTPCSPASRPARVSGAPKMRAMEIIDELEPEARGPYAGAVGYLGSRGDLDTCIAIRTLVVRDGRDLGARPAPASSPTPTRRPRSGRPRTRPRAPGSPRSRRAPASTRRERRGGR